MRAVVVDDEPIARRRLIRMLEAVGEVEIVGEADNGLEARETIDRLRPDVVFLDIRMPGLDGLSLAIQASGSLPPVVFTTAYDEYAVQAFEAEAVDYLLKPIEPDRLQRALDRVRRRTETAPPGDRLETVLQQLVERPPIPRVSARLGSTVRLFDARSIGRFSARRKYVAFTHQGEVFLTEESIQALEDRLSRWGFVRVHRSELVNLRHVVALHVTGSAATLELTGGPRVPVSRRRRAILRRALGLGDAQP